MTNGAHRPARLLPVVGVLALLAMGQVVRAQDDDDLEPEIAAKAKVQAPVLPDNMIDQWIFNNAGMNAGGNPRGQVEALLKVRIAELGRTCGATEAQKKKLELAGQGDIKRFFDQVEEIKRKNRPLTNDRDTINRVFQEVRPLQTAVTRGLFSEGSMFAKTIRRTLGEEQLARYEEAQAERRRFRYRAQVDAIIKQLDAALGLSVDQRHRFAELLLKRTRPPRVASGLDFQFVMYQASQLPRDEVRAIFDDAQWRVMSKQLDQVKGMGPLLKNNGYLSEDDAGAPAGKPIKIERRATGKEGGS